jgi:hypothetical protein
LDRIVSVPDRFLAPYIDGRTPCAPQVQFPLDRTVIDKRKDLEMLPTAMTVRLGSIIAVGLGILFAALKLT